MGGYSVENVFIFLASTPKGTNSFLFQRKSVYRKANRKSEKLSGLDKMAENVQSICIPLKFSLRGLSGGC